MSVNGDEVEEEYESDPEDAIVPSRRREASDDEEDEKLDGDRSGRKERTSVIESDGESDGEGAPAAYEEEEVEEDEEEEVDEGAEFEEEEEVVEGEVGGEGEGEGEKVVEEDGNKDEEGGEKKENVPYAVPTSGAFYMHDDRFQSNGRGRQRRMPGGRGLWESKDDRAWVHDRFEEMNLHDTHYGEGRRNSRGRFRGRGGGRTRGSGRGYAKSNRPRGYSDDGNNQNRAPKTVRGRGRRYEPISKNNEVPAPQHKQSGRSQEPRSNTSVGRPSMQTSNVQPDSALPSKQVFASSLNSASPPFYPSSSSKQDISVTQGQSGSATKSVSSSMQMENTSLAPQSVPLSRGKSIVNSVSDDRPYVNDSLRSVAGSTFASGQFQSSGSPLTTASTTQSAQSSVQGKKFKITTPSNFQQTSSLSEVARVRPQIQPSFQHRQTQFQPVLRNSAHQASQQRLSIGNQVSSPPHVPSTNASEVGEPDLRPGSSKSKSQLVSKAKSNNQGAARGSFLYSGAQVIGASGAMGLNHKDQNFSGTPPLLPVMQFGGHHGGLGVPAVGMALPGYVAGNSEMTWLPVLAGAGGALGASYPYIALDGNYYPHPSGQSSSSVASSRESIGTKHGNTMKPAQKPEIVNDEFGQRQNKPRRYSEMNFGQ